LFKNFRSILRNFVQDPKICVIRVDRGQVNET